jgi:hypothetical protein
MCNFLSWIEKDGELFFLTTEDVESRRGKDYPDYNPCPADILGHGAIRWFYRIEGGEDKECTDFSTPENFPKELQNAIVRAKFRRWFGPVPIGLLRKPIDDEYRAKLTTIDDEYRAKRKPIDDE